MVVKDIFYKLKILSISAKYDVSCSSSGAGDYYRKGELGSTKSSGICHSFTPDGRCISLLKVLFTNFCIYDCAYCINRASNDVERASFTPQELADLTINFYKRNYIEGLFLSSGIIKDENHTMELLLKTLKILRYQYRFNGYIHTKLIPNSSPEIIKEVMKLSSRVSSNIELPSAKSLMLLAPDKSKDKVLGPIKAAKNFSLNTTGKAASLTTQIIVGATPETDYDILQLSSSLYKKQLLKRVYYSAYIPINQDNRLPAVTLQPPLLREHRLYQADWLIRFYNFSFDEIVNEKNMNLNEALDPKSFWALNNLHLFPIEINKADFMQLIRIPGIGIRGAHKIVKARKYKRLNFEDLKYLKISLKRAKFFITADGKYSSGHSFEKGNFQNLLIPEKKNQNLIFTDLTPITGEL